MNKFRTNGLSIDSKAIYVNRKTAEKYTNPKENILSQTKTIKSKGSTELDNLLEISKKENTLPDKKAHAFAQDGWEHYKTNFRIGNEYFSGIINIGKNGEKRTLYDITNIKKTTQTNKVDKSTASLNESSFSTGNILQPNNNVKSDIPSSNYSMQNSEKNTLDEYLNKNYKSPGTQTDM